MVVERKWRLGWNTAGIPVGVLYHPPVVDILEGVAGYLLLVGAATAILIAEGEPGVFVECRTSTAHMWPAGVHTEARSGFGFGGTATGKPGGKPRTTHMRQETCGAWEWTRGP